MSGICERHGAQIFHQAREQFRAFADGNQVGGSERIHAIRQSFEVGAHDRERSAQFMRDIRRHIATEVILPCDFIRKELKRFGQIADFVFGRGGQREIAFPAREPDHRIREAPEWSGEAPAEHQGDDQPDRQGDDGGECQRLIKARQEGLFWRRGGIIRNDQGPLDLIGHHDRDNLHFR